MKLIPFLREKLPRLELEADFSFSRHTTIGCGGIAEAVAYPSCTEETACLLNVLRREKIPYCLLGAGANVLPPEGRYGGVVVRSARLNAIYADGETLYAGAGVTGGALLKAAERLNLSGCEPFSGIPMTVGGAAAMNAGVRARHMSDLVARVVAVDGGKIRTFSVSECGFAEKDSVFLGGIAVTGVYLRLHASDARSIRAEAERFRLLRRDLPKGRSMGCVFVNPAGGTAGRIIEECGLKGRSVGGARVSERHANFILNEGGSSDDVAALIGLVKREVREKTGIELREEIRRIPPA